ncbi:MAG: DUF6064 family protein [Balneolaceae bacterium]|nr:DUF6064 family protein [Balneolaceae bacterium]
MELPFTADQFLNLFREYNTAIWPAQIAAYLLGFAAVFLTHRKEIRLKKSILAILGIFWIWMGGLYHLMFFSTINGAAYLFGAFFILQGVLFLFAGAGRRQPEFEFMFRNDAYGWTGSLFILYAVLIYPVIGSLLGHSYPQAPLFGVAPCPTTIFTFGILLWTRGRVPGWLLVIPTLWSIVGFLAALRLGIREDIGLLVAGLVGAAMLLYRNRHQAQKRMTPSPG